MVPRTVIFSLWATASLTAFKKSAFTTLIQVCASILFWIGLRTAPRCHRKTITSVGRVVGVVVNLTGGLVILTFIWPCQNLPYNVKTKSWFLRCVLTSHHWQQPVHGVTLWQVALTIVNMWTCDKRMIVKPLQILFASQALTHKLSI